MSWTPKPLGEILEQSGRYRAGDQNLPVLSITMKHGLVDQADKFKKRVASSDTSNYRVAYKNELVVGFPIDEGVLGFQTKYPAGIVSPAYDIWKLRSEVDSHIPYLERYLRSSQARGSYASRMQGAVARRRSLTKTDFLALEIPFPPLDDQIRIAHLLGKVEGLIAQRRQHLQQLDDLLKSVFLAMFGPGSTGYEDWPLVEVRELAAKHKGAMRTGPFGSNLLHSEFAPDGDVAVLGIDNAVQNRFAWGERRFISNEKYQELESYRVFPGDVIVTIMGTIGRSAVIPDDIPVAINTKHLAAITLNREAANPLFLSYAIHSSPFVLRQFESKNRGAIMSGLNLGIIKETKIKRAPIDLQNRFAEIHSRVDHLKSSYQQSLTDLEALYGALSQQAFKGELDLSRMALPAAPAVGESPMAAPVPAPNPTPEIVLPETDLLLLALQDRTQLAPLLCFWLEAYRTQLGGVAFSLERFISAVQTRLGELHPDNDFALHASDYEIIKAWIFKALTAGALTQAFDDDGNRIELRAAAEKSLV